MLYANVEEISALAGELNVFVSRVIEKDLSQHSRLE